MQINGLVLIIPNTIFHEKHLCLQDIEAAFSNTDLSVAIVCCRRRRQFLRREWPISETLH